MALGWVNRLGATDRLCETLVSWRLLVGGLSPWASHRSYSTTSEEPPLSNFNSYRDIPLTAQGSTIQRGAAVAPVPLNMAGLNPALVREGSYIVNAQGGCNDCHTVPSYAAGGNPFIGQPEVVNAACYLAGGAAFGPFVSRNLTPRANGLPAGRTLAEFKEIMHAGTDFRTPRTAPRSCR